MTQEGMAVLKKVVLIIISVIMAFSAFEVNAAGVVTESVIDLSLEAQHYYNTKIAYADMTVYRVNEKLYEVIHYTQSGKSIKVQLFQTDWGTWNLGNMNIVDNGLEKNVIGGGTDWEYVFRVFNPINQNLEFTGGNHGSEICNSLVMYDSVTGLGVDLEVGESMYVNRLVIEEKTTILLANMDYLPYADVKRVYTIVGDTVNLDCEITFLRDVRMAQSYSAMACINKDFSRYINFGNTVQYNTGASGTCSNKYYGNTAASVCYLSGDDLSATVTVGIYNEKDMTDNFSNRDKTFVWDMSDSYNKLYFSKYNMTILEAVPAGTVWNFGSYWRVNLQ